MLEIISERALDRKAKQWDSNGKIWCLRRLVKEEVLDGAFQHPYNQILSISGPVTVAFPTLWALAKRQKKKDC